MNLIITGIIWLGFSIFVLIVFAVIIRWILQISVIIHHLRELNKNTKEKKAEQEKTNKLLEDFLKRLK
jgi:ABC-type bacteriocin/lantibiotic exporter with double-glycine peptidase domain